MFAAKQFVTVYSKVCFINKVLQFLCEDMCGLNYLNICKENAF